MKRLFLRLILGMPTSSNPSVLRAIFSRCSSYRRRPYPKYGWHLPETSHLNASGNFLPPSGHEWREQPLDILRQAADEVPRFCRVCIALVYRVSGHDNGGNPAHLHARYPEIVRSQKYLLQPT